MDAPEIRVAQLDRELMARIETLEKELGAVVVAYEPSYKPANLSEDQVAKVRAVEADLGLILVAFSAE